MSTLNAPKRISKKHELREDRVITLYARAWNAFDKNRKLVYGALAALAVLIVVAVGYVFYLSRQADQADQHLSQIVPVFERGEYRQALDGTDGRLGLIEIADRFGRSSAGNLSRFYAADALFRLEEYDQALAFFRDYRKGRDFLGASALAGEAAVYENHGEYARAAEAYQRAARHFDNELTSPQYLLSAGRAFELAGRYADAQTAYEAIRQQYPESTLANEIDVYIARAAARQQS